MADSTSLSKAVVVQTQEEERYRLARALQNGPAQIYANAALEIQNSLRLMDEQPADARRGLTALVSELRRGLNDLRVLIEELQPPLLSELGLAACLERYTDAYSQRTGLAVSLLGWDTLIERWPPTMEMAMFRIIQEALENVNAHAQATRVTVALTNTSERLVMTVADDGHGFPTGKDPLTPGRRLGLVAMQDRAEMLGGQLQIFSEPGRGVRVVLSVPVHRRSSQV